MLQTLAFNLNLFLLLTTNMKSDGAYCGGRGRIFKLVLQKSLHEFLILQPVIILIISFFLILKCVIVREEFPKI